MEQRGQEVAVVGIIRLVVGVHRRQRQHLAQVQAMVGPQGRRDGDSIAIEGGEYIIAHEAATNVEAQHEEALPNGYSLTRSG